jgi:hypothetical protein
MPVLAKTAESAGSQQSIACPYFAAATRLLLLDLLLLLLLLNAAASLALLVTGAAPKTAAASFARGSSNARHCGLSDVLFLLSAEQERATPAKLAGNWSLS